MATRLINAIVVMVKSAISHTSGTSATAPKYTMPNTAIRKMAIVSQWLLMNCMFDSA